MTSPRTRTCGSYAALMVSDGRHQPGHGSCRLPLDRAWTNSGRGPGGDAQGFAYATSDPKAVIDHADAVCSAELVAGLDPERRTAFVLTQVFGLTYAEVATISNCAPGTVASRVARAREDLISATQADRAPRSDEG